MLANFLEALRLTGAEKKIKRVLLTTGAKQYGVHLGPVKVPMEETDPWIEGPGRPPNFYYRQQYILKDASKGKNWDWVRCVRAIAWFAALTLPAGRDVP